MEKYRITYFGKSDKKGRCSFMLEWMADYHPGDPRGEHREALRGQVFFANPEERGFPSPEYCEKHNKNNEYRLHYPY
jgi:hypothetical protein